MCRLVPRLTLSALAFSALCAANLSAAPAVQTVPPPFIARDTTIQLSLDTPLRSGQAKVGDSVHFTVAREVDGSNHTRLIAKGAPGVGHVTESTAKGSFGQRGRLAFTCDSVRDVNGTQIPLHLIVVAGPDSGPAADAADEADAQDYHAFSTPVFDPNKFVQSPAPGGYYFQQSCLIASVTYNPGRFFGSEDVEVKPGQEYKAKVAADTSL